MGAIFIRMGILAMDSELKSRISGIVEVLARQEQQRLKAAGTLIELEELVCEIGDEVTRQLLSDELVDRANSADGQPQSCPTCDCPCQVATSRQRNLLSSRGEIHYHEPAYYCRYCRRSFFPGGRCDGSADAGESHAETDPANGLGR